MVPEAGDRSALDHSPRRHPAARSSPCATDGRTAGGTSPYPPFEVFEVEVEEEEQQPSLVLASYFMDAAGRSWCA